MNIAYITPEAVFPANTGGRVVVYNRIKYLADYGNDIYLFEIVDSQDEANIQINSLKGIVKDVHCYVRSRLYLKTVLRTIKYPYAVASRISDEMISDLCDSISEKKIDRIVCEFPQVFLNVLPAIRKFNIPCVLSQHNIEYQAMNNIAEGLKNPLKKAIYRFESRRLFRYENGIYSEDLVNAYIFVSKDDKDFFEKSYPNVKKTELIPIGAGSHSRLDSYEKDNNVIIVGKMSYPPNVDGVLWFVDKVWPKILAKKKEAMLYIVGKDPAKEIAELSCDTIVVTGTVESVEPYYLKGKVAVVPVFTGGGVKTKLIEAASFGIPIVSTCSGAKGTDFENGIHISITDDPQTFADSVVDAMNDAEDSMKMAENAYELYEQNYTWKTICGKMNDFLTNL